MNPQEFEEFKKELISRFLGRYDDLIAIISDEPKDREYHIEAIPNYIFHEWTAYTQALNEFDIVTDEQYEELRKIDIEKEYFAIDSFPEEIDKSNPDLGLSEFGKI
jgi:hypothetical protein